MTDTTQTDIERIREQAAAEEREAILELIDHYMRQLAHGHGATGAQVLQHLADQVARRRTERK